MSATTISLTWSYNQNLNPIDFMVETVSRNADADFPNENHEQSKFTQKTATKKLVKKSTAHPSSSIYSSLL